MLEYSLRVLEYNQVLNILSNYAASPLGRSHCLSLKPLKEPELVEAEQKLVSEMKELLLVRGFVSLSGLKDLGPLLKKSFKKGWHLTPKDLLSIPNLIANSNRAKKWIRSAKDLCPSLWEIADKLPVLDQLAGEIETAITEEGGISDSASPEIASVRSQRAALRRSIEKKLNALLNRISLDEESLISVRDGRYTISVRSEKKGHAKGIIHGYSSTYSTCSIEPLEVVEDNNRLVYLNDKEEQEEKKVLERLTALVSGFSYPIQECQEIMGRIDGVFARAEFSRAINGISPVLSAEKIVYLLDALNPILIHLYIQRDTGEKKRAISRAVPIDVKMDAERAILIISGPNMGGKTVALKTIGLLSLMFQSGLHIPAKEGSKLSVFNHVLAEIGDDQDISAGLSTFSARVEHLKEITDHAGENSLVILDELGTGTDPDEGCALAMGILDYLSDNGSLCALSTHYQRLKTYGLVNKKVQNASVEFDSGKGRPGFKLIAGVPGVSHGIEVARDMGIRRDIIERADGYLGKKRKNMDSVMENLSGTIKELEQEKEAAATARQEYVESGKVLEEEKFRLSGEYNRILREKERDAQRILQEAKRELGNAIGYLKEKGPFAQKEATQRYRKAKDNLMEWVQGTDKRGDSVAPGSINIGQRVYHKKSGRKGLVVGMDEDSSKARIIVGNLRLDVDKSELSPDPVEPGEKRDADNKGKNWSVSAGSPETGELNLVGYRVSEAIPLVDRIIDDALVSGNNKIKIIHGIGSGTLKRAIRNHLSEDYCMKGLISGYRDGRDGGTTVVDL